MEKLALASENVFMHVNLESAWVISTFVYLDQDYKNIVNVVSRKVSLTRAALSEKILQPTPLGRMEAF